MVSNYNWTEKVKLQEDNSVIPPSIFDSEGRTHVENESVIITASENELTVQPNEKYSVISHIDQGGMKSILEVKDRDTMRNMAMAVLADEGEAQCKEGFIQEARITANLEHPNIMPIHDIGVDETGAPYFTMKLVRGETLARIIQKLRKGHAHYIRKYTLSHLLQIFRKVCDAINFAHSKGVIHLDIKPGNILVGEYGEVLVLDWGLAKYIGDNIIQTPDEDGESTDTIVKISQSEVQRTIDGEIKGTPGYMAPEQAAGKNQEKDMRTDIYSLGAILYYILTWRTSIYSKDLEKVFNETITGDFIPPRKRAPERMIPEALEAITLKAMANKPEERYQRAKKLIKDLDKYEAGRVTSAENASWLKLLNLFLRRRKVEAVLVIVVIVAALLVTGVWVKSNWKRKASWGAGEYIMPENETQLDDEWDVSGGNWVMRNGRLVATSGKGDNFQIFYKRPVYGKIAFEFKGRIPLEADLEKSGDLSIILCGNPVTLNGYYLQVGGVGNSSAVIQRKNGMMSSIAYRLKPGDVYRVRAEKEGEWIRLFCNEKLLLKTRDIFYLEGGCVGLYTFGKGKEFWDIRLYHRGVPEVVSPLIEGDSYYRQSRAAAGEIRKKLLVMARKAYHKVFESHPDKELGYEALLKKAYVDIELGNIADAQFDCGYLERNHKNLEQMLLKGDLAFINEDFDSAYSIFKETIKEYPDSRVGITGILMGRLNKVVAEKMDKKLLNDFWRLCAENQATNIIRCRQKGLTSLDFLKGLEFELIDCSENNIESLVPLKGSKVKMLDCAGNDIADISPLKGMPLVELELHNNPRLTNIDALRGMPLKTLTLNGCKGLKDISPLKGCQTLERVVLPKHFKDTTVLQGLPTLKSIRFE